jgi:hypothetical protein
MTGVSSTTAAFDVLIAALGEIRDRYVLDTDRFTDSIDVLDAYRYVGQSLSAMSELFLESDPDHPRFVSIVSPARKLQGDNPDAVYHYAAVGGDRAYRVTGTIDRQCYTSFTVHGAAADGGLAGPLLGDVNDRDFVVAEDGTYELVFSAEKQLGNWLQLHPDAVAIIVRSYYQLPVSAQNDPTIAVHIDITTLDTVDPPPPLDDATVAARLMRGVAFLRQLTIGQNPPGGGAEVPFVSNVVNDVATPFSFRDSGLPVPGAADIFYSMGRWDLAPDEAIEMTGRIPLGPFANVMLWNVHMQTLNYRDRRSSLNAAQITYEVDGSYRIVISAQDPGVANWLDTDGHRRGSIFWRFLLPETDPLKPECRVVRVADLR